MSPTGSGTFKTSGPWRDRVRTNSKAGSSFSALSSPLFDSQSSGSGFSTIAAATDETGDSVAVGLSDPSNTGTRKEMLQLINRLRDTGVQTDIDLPMIVVVGSQSAGKSSLIESISGITFPRSSGTCTRCPTECKLIRSDGPWKCVVKLHFSTDSDGAPSLVRIVSFGDPITSQPFVEDRIRRAQRAILNPSEDPKDYLLDDHDDLPDENELTFSKNYVSLEISGSELADLSFVDLPGLIASVGRTGDEGDIELVKALVISYIQRPSCVILLTVACETDFENQGAHHLAKSFDPEGKRTVGVLTKPDRIAVGDEQSWIKILRNETEPLVNNWYCVKQPSSQALSKGITWSDARRQENEFFTATQPWCSLEPQYQKFLRTSHLTERLSVILSELIAKRLPEIQGELVNAIRDTETRLRKLPRAPSHDPLGEVLHVVTCFSRDLSRLVQGTPNRDGLLQTIRPHQQTFRRAVRCTAPSFVPWGKNLENATKSLSKAAFLASEEGDESNELDSEDSEDSEDIEDNELDLDMEQTDAYIRPQRIYIDEVLKQAESACTRELPDNYPFVVQQYYIKEFTKKWEQPAMDLFDRVYVILKTELGKLVDVHFANMGKGTAKHSVLMIVNDHLDGAASRTKQRIGWLLDLEEAPATLNTHYYADYKDKFLAYYKGYRNDSDLVTKLKTAFEPSFPRTSARFSPPTSQESVSKVLSGLSELGITVKATELTKLLPPDPMAPALDIMASVRAYFQVAYKRFADMVPMAIDHEIVLGLQKGIDKVVQDGLQITGPDGYKRCKSMVEEASSITSARQEILKKMERLQAARQELKKLV